MLHLAFYHLQAVTHHFRCVLNFTCLFTKYNSQKLTELPVDSTLPVMLSLLKEKEMFNPHVLLVLNMQVRKKSLSFVHIKSQHSKE